jgi:hypothetical protein
MFDCAGTWGTTSILGTPVRIGEGIGTSVGKAK